MGNNQTKNKVGPLKSINISDEKSLARTKGFGFFGKKKFILGIIDPQNDFFTGGSLAIDDSKSIIGPINKLRFFCWDLMETFVSQDYHPRNHMSFAKTHQVDEFTKKELKIKLDETKTIQIVQDMWPVHCVNGTPGANINNDIIISETDHNFKKGTQPHIESYSAFGDEFLNKYENTGLDNFLQTQGITDIVLVGLATDYCVLNTALDACRLGYQVHLIKSCVRGVKPDTTQQAFEKMEEKNVCIYDDVNQFIEVVRPYL